MVVATYTRATDDERRALDRATAARQRAYGLDGRLQFLVVLAAVIQVNSCGEPLGVW